MPRAANGIVMGSNHSRTNLNRGFRPRGFSLVELLVVISIIALLVAILLPSLARAREGQRTVCCCCNLHQWGVAIHLYTASSGGMLPRRGQGVRPLTKINRPDDWFNALPPVMKMRPYVELARRQQQPKVGDATVWMCPNARDPGGEHFLPYAMNMMLSTWKRDRPVSLIDLEPLATMVFMADAPGAYSSVVPSYEEYSPVARHAGRVNLVFLDGHSKTRLGETVGCGTGDPHRADIRWIPPGNDWPEPGQPDS